MTKLAFRGIRASLGRLALTTIAIVAGVGFVTGSFILADSLSQTFGTLFENITDTIDARVEAEELEFGRDEQALDDSLAETLAALPEVGRATPEVEYDSEGGSLAPFAIIGEDGETIQPTGPPIITFSWDGDTDEDLLTIVDGSPPEGQGQVTIDDVQAEAAGVEVGDTVTMATPSGDQEFEIASIVNLPITGGAWFVLFDFDTAQVLYDKVGQVDQVSLSRAPGVSTEDMIAAVEEVIPDHARVQNQQEVLEEDSADFEMIIGVIRNALLAFAGIALFVSLFIIYNTFAILVNQRLVQIGMLRAVGATRSQITLSVVIEAMIVGVTGSIIGFGFGFAVATGIKAAFQATGGFPDTTTVIEPRTIVVSLLVGVIATTVSALLPAIKAGRVSPVAAIRNEPPSRRSARFRTWAGAVITFLGLALLGLGLFAQGQEVQAVLFELGAGAILTFIGVSMLSVLFAGPVVQFIGRPEVLGLSLTVLGIALPVVTFTVGEGVPEGLLAAVGFGLKMLIAVIATVVGLRILSNTIRARSGGRASTRGAAGVAGSLARQNAARSPQRTAATATALTIGVALVATVGVVGESLKSSFASSFSSSFNADLYVFNDQGGNLPAELADELESVPGIDQVSRFRANEVKQDDNVDSLSAYNADTGEAVVTVSFTEGSGDALVDNGVLLDAQTASDRGIGVGDVVELQFPTGGTESLTVTGLHDSGGIFDSTWVVDMAVYDRQFNNRADFGIAATITEGQEFDDVQAGVKALTDKYGSGKPQSAQEFLGSVDDQIDTLITLINYMLGFALVVAFLGVINTIVLSVIERTREIGLLRAVGMTRDQVRSTIRWEAIIVCLFGAALGVVLGILFSIAAVSAIPDSVIDTVAVPYETILFVILAAALAGVVAALLPAYRAARLNVLNAIANE